MNFNKARGIIMTMKQLQLKLVLTLTILTGLLYPLQDTAWCMSARPPEPEAECLYGLFMSNRPVDIYAINEFEVATCKKAGMIMFYMDWRGSFPKSDCQKIIDYGAIPHVTWEPWVKEGDKNLIYLDNIISGEWDGYIRQWAKDAAEFKEPFILRVGHEMNGNWYPWSGYANDKDPQKFVDAYRHIHDIFTEEGADNAIWLWCPMDSEVPNRKWNHYTNYYPGDEYVDWIGLDGYNWGKTQQWSRWVSFKDIFKRRYDDMLKLYPDKPFMIGEFASAEVGGDKARWIEETFKVIKEEFPELDAFVWFNINKECDWRINSSAEAMAAYSLAMKDPYYGSDPEEFSRILDDFELPEGVSTELVRLAGPAFEIPTVSIKKIDKDIIIDGNLEEYSGLEPIEIAGSKYVVLGVDDWSGYKDLSADVYLAWDKENIYFSAVVNDDAPLNNIHPDKNMWDGDGIEIALGADPEADPQRIELAASDYQVCFTVTDELHNWCFQLAREIDEIEAVIIKNESSYVLEARIPLEVFDYEPEAGDKVRFNIAVNDADYVASRQTQILLSGNADYYKDPSQWAWLVFVEE